MAHTFPKAVTVAPNKGRIIILNPGEPEFAQVWTHENRGERRTPSIAYVPHGLVVESKCGGRFWVFETRINRAEGGVVEYRCKWKGHPETGGWRRNPSAAYVATNDTLEMAGLGNPTFNRKENGALLVGITYPSVQKVIREHFGLPVAQPPAMEIPLFFSAATTKVARYQTASEAAAGDSEAEGETEDGEAEGVREVPLFFSSNSSGGPSDD